MATIIVCDGGCGKQSPDVEKLHIANHWTQVWHSSDPLNRRPPAFPQKIFCDECWLRVTKAFHP